jgi:glycosyltransferase involved in cell wall biosynthesis
MVRDKGIRELVTAWKQLRAEFPQLHLLLVGTIENGGCLPASTICELRSGDRVHMPGWNWETERFYAAMDVLALPSYREGMAYSLLEGAAMALPTVTSRVTGCIDAIVDGVTGTAVPPADVSELIAAIRRYLKNPELRRRHGLAGRARILRDFRPQDVWNATFRHYQRRLETVGDARIPLQRAA